MKATQIVNHCSLLLRVNLSDKGWAGLSVLYFTIFLLHFLKTTELMIACVISFKNVPGVSLLWNYGFGWSFQLCGRDWINVFITECAITICRFIKQYFCQQLMNTFLNCIMLA